MSHPALTSSAVLTRLLPYGIILGFVVLAAVASAIVVPMLTTSDAKVIAVKGTSPIQQPKPARAPVSDPPHVSGSTSMSDVIRPIQDPQRSIAVFLLAPQDPFVADTLHALFQHADKPALVRAYVMYYGNTFATPRDLYTAYRRKVRRARTPDYSSCIRAHCSRAGAYMGPLDAYTAFDERFPDVNEAYVLRLPSCVQSASGWDTVLRDVLARCPKDVTPMLSTALPLANTKTTRDSNAKANTRANMEANPDGEAARLRRGAVVGGTPLVPLHWSSAKGVPLPVYGPDTDPNRVRGEELLRTYQRGFSLAFTFEALEEHRRTRLAPLMLVEGADALVHAMYVTRGVSPVCPDRVPFQRLARKDEQGGNIATAWQKKLKRQQAGKEWAATTQYLRRLLTAPGAAEQDEYETLGVDVPITAYWTIVGADPVGRSIVGGRAGQGYDVSSAVPARALGGAGGAREVGSTADFSDYKHKDPFGSVPPEEFESYYAIEY